MNFIQAIFLSVVEGLTEFLPISSTGHLILTADLLNIPQTDFVKSFEIVIQLGAILAVILLYWKKFLDKDVLKLIALAFLPTVIVGFLLYPFIKESLLGNSQITLIALFIGGVILIFIELIHKERDYDIEKLENIPYVKAFLIGVFQSFSVIPGVSRAAATIIGGLILGSKRKVAAEFSFLLAVPTMIAATGLDLFRSEFSFNSQEVGILTIGLLVSFAVALASIKFLLGYIQNHSFILFGIYRIVVSILFWILIIK